MKRSERYRIKSRNAAGWSAVLIMTAIAGACWMPSAIQMIFPAALAVLLSTIAAAFFGFSKSMDAIRLRSLSIEEKMWEDEREVRPRL